MLAVKRVALPILSPQIPQRFPWHEIRAFATRKTFVTEKRILRFENVIMFTFSAIKH